jgi:hypothetical protein
MWTTMSEAMRDASLRASSLEPPVGSFDDAQL